MLGKNTDGRFANEGVIGVKCPKCKANHMTLGDNGQLVSRSDLEICYFCGFILKSSESERFKERCAEMIQRHITSYKRTKDEQYISKAEVYFQALKEEVKEHAH